MKWWAWLLSVLGHLCLLCLWLWHASPAQEVVSGSTLIHVHLVNDSLSVPAQPLPVARPVPAAHHPHPVSPPRVHPSQTGIPVLPKKSVRHHRHATDVPTMTDVRRLLTQDLSRWHPPAVSPVPVSHPPVPTATTPAAGVIANPRYAQRLRAHIYHYAVLPWQWEQAGPVSFRVSQDHEGRVLAVETVHHSGVPAYDDALYRAILLASPLPLPKNPRDFEAVLLVTFYPGE